MSHLNITFDRYASIGNVMHFILVISVRKSPKVKGAGQKTYNVN